MKLFTALIVISVLCVVILSAMYLFHIEEYREEIEQAEERGIVIYTR